MTVRPFISAQWDAAPWQHAALPESAAGSTSATVCGLYKTALKMGILFPPETENKCKSVVNHTA